MAIDENLKETVKDLRFNQHKTIREIAEITAKSNRDIMPVLSEPEDKNNAEEAKNIQGEYYIRTKTRKRRNRTSRSSSKY